MTFQKWNWMLFSVTFVIEHFFLTGDPLRMQLFEKCVMKVQYSHTNTHNIYSTKDCDNHLPFLRSCPKSCFTKQPDWFIFIMLPRDSPTSHIWKD